MEHNYNKGSEWRKWDLHFHTPSSYDYQDGSVTNQKIIDEMLANNISVVAITDHHTIDVDRIIDLQKLAKGKITILPGIECCSELGGSESIHFIGIFSENSDIESIWTKIQGKHNLTKADILSKGNDRIICKFEETCQTIIELGGVVSVHAGKKTNSIESIKNNLLVKQEHKQELLSKYINILEIGKTEDENDYKTKVFPAIGFSLPIVICSDNHNINSYDFKENLWIKADATFEGLKQIISEPEERVKIQDSNPNNEKRLYNIIEKVKLIDKSDKKRFPTQEIGFNPNLNAIIGGKSSGKSLLMHMIAKELGNITDNKDYSEILTDVEIEVFYADNIEEKSSAEDKRIVEFLPQLHIEKIVRNKSETRKSIDGSTRYFNKFIEDLIRQNENINRCFTSHQEIIKQATARINESITKWMEFDKDFTREKKELQPLGDKTAINGEIKRINEQIKLITENAGLTEDELVQYTQLTVSNKYNTLRVSCLNEELSELRRLVHYANRDVLQQIKQSLIFKTNTPTTLALYNKFVSELPEVIQPKIDSFIAEVNSKGQEIVSSIEEHSKTISENNKLLEPLLDKNKLQEEIKLLENKLTSEKKKITDIENKEATINDIKNNRDTIDLIEDYTLIVNSYAALKDNITNSMAVQWENSKANLTLSANSIFDSSMFTNTIGTVIDLRSYLETQFAGCGFNSNEYKFINENHISNIKSIWEKCTADENRFANFKGYGNIEKLLRAIFEDCFYIDYDIKKGNDSLQKMSEGKKGIVILQLYLSLSKADCPILIDQPEDNLDNRTVYIELNDYIKRSKQRRQIIMVSHNANLVVNTDAENIIVANQSGEDGKDNKDFQFEYVNGALENTSPLDRAQKGILYQQGIREHVCEVLEGGTEAFKKREEKYHLK